jgi:hypothetical protein
MNLSEIYYPVFRLKKERPSTHDGIEFYAYERYEETDEGLVCHNIIRIIDDNTYNNEKLSLRRLAIKATGGTLYRLNRAIFFLSDLIKLSIKGHWFIDSKGKIFQYIKTTKVALNYYKIKKVIAVPTGGAIIEVEGIPNRFKCLHFPEYSKTHVGILHMGLSLLLYGFYDQQYKNSWRKV